MTNLTGRERKELQRLYELAQGGLGSEYERLAYVIAETQGAGAEHTTAVQDAIAGKVGAAFERYYQEHTQGWENDPINQYREKPSRGAWFAKNPLAVQDVLNQNIDLSFERWARQDKTPGVVDDFFHEAFQQTTVGGATKWLAQSQMPSVWQQVSRPYRDARGDVAFRTANLDQIRDEFQEGNLGMIQSVLSYDATKGGSFTVHAAGASYNAIKRYRDREKQYMAHAQYGTDVMEGDNGFEDTGYAIDPNTGEWLGDLASGLAENLAGGMRQGTNFQNDMVDYTGGNWVHSLTNQMFEGHGNAIHTVQAGWTGERPPVAAYNLGNPDLAFQQRNNDQIIHPPTQYVRKDDRIDVVEEQNRMPSQIYTTSPEYASGIIRGEKGWKIAPLSPNYSQEYSVPVQFEPGALRTFGDIYEDMRQTWNVWEGDYETATMQAEKNVTQRLINRNATGNLPKDYNFQQLVDAETLQLLPKETPRPGTPMYEQWKSAQVMMDELNDVRGLLNRPGAPEPLSENMDIADAAWSSTDAVANPGIDARYFRPGYGQAILARKEVSSAGNYILGQQRGMLMELAASKAPPNFAEMMQIIQHPVPGLSLQEALQGPVNGSGGANRTANLNTRYPAMVGVQGQSVPPSQLNRVNRDNVFPANSLFYDDPSENFNPNYNAPGPLGPSTPFTPGQPVNGPGYLDPNPFYARTFSYPLEGPQQAFTPVHPSALTDKNYAGAEKRPWNAPNPKNDDPFLGPQKAIYPVAPYSEGRPDLAGDLELTAYSASTELNRNSRFTPGSMNEDDWEWENRKNAPNYPNMPNPTGPGPEHERTARTASDYDNSVLGGDPGSEEYLNQDGSVHVQSGQYTFAAQQFGQVYNRITHEPLDTHRQVNPARVDSSLSVPDAAITQAASQGAMEINAPAPMSYYESGKQIDRNNLDFRLDATTDANFVMDPQVRTAIQAELNQRARRGDAVDESSDNAEALAEERDQQNALSGITDAEGPDVGISTRVAAEGIKKGYFRTPWKTVFSRFNEITKHATATFNMLRNTKADEKGAELQEALNDFQSIGNKAAWVGIRMGETPKDQRDMLREQWSDARSTLRMVGENLGVKLHTRPGEEAALYDDLFTLRTAKDIKSQKTYAAISAQFAQAGEQWRAMLQWKGQLPQKVSSAGNIKAKRGTYSKEEVEARRKKAVQDNLRKERLHPTGEDFKPVEQDANINQNVPDAPPDPGDWQAAEAQATAPIEEEAGEDGVPEAPPDPDGWTARRIPEAPEEDAPDLNQEFTYGVNNARTAFYPEARPDPRSWSKTKPVQRNTPAPARADSHSNLAPGGRSQAKYSQNQINAMKGPRAITTDENGVPNFENVPPPARDIPAPQIPVTGGGGTGSSGGNNGDDGEPPEMPNDIYGEPPEEDGGQGQGPTPQPQHSNGKLTPGQQNITYASPMDPKLSGQVEHFLDPQNKNRTRFNIIADEKASKSFLGAMRGAIEGEFDAQGYQFTGWSQVQDKSLPPGYVKWGGSVAPIQANGNGHSNGTQQQAAPAAPAADTDPANFPMTPGGKGYRMTFSRWDSKERHGVSVTAWGRENDQGELGWYEKNAEGNMEPLRNNPGFGKIYDDKGVLLNDVDRDARNFYDAMNAPLSSAGNQTGQPTRTVITDPAQMPAPEAGMMLKFRDHGTDLFMHAVENEETGEYQWALRSTVGGGNEMIFRNAPGYGQVIQDGKVVADVKREDYEKYMASKATVLKPDPPPDRVYGGTAPTPTPAVSARRANASTTFSRFNVALNDANARFTQNIVNTDKPSRYNLNNADMEGFRRGAANEFYGLTASTWNQMIDEPPQNLQDVVDALSANLGVPEEFVQDAAEVFWGQMEQSQSRHMPMQKEQAFRAAKPQRRAAMDMSAEGRGAPGWRALGQDRVSTMGTGVLDDFKSPSLGEVFHEAFTDGNGVTRSERYVGILGSNGRPVETVTPNQVQQAYNIAQKAYSEATAGDLPSTPDSIMATVKERMYSSVQKQMLEEVNKAMEQGGMSRTEANAHAEVIREVAEHYTKKAAEQVRQSLGETVGEVSGVATERHDAKVASYADAKKLYTENEEVRKALRGRSLAETMNSGEETIVFDDNGRSYSLGGPKGARVDQEGNDVPDTGYPKKAPTGRNQLHGAQGLLSGGTGGKGIGSILYGMYMLNREWQMAGAPVMAETEAYAKDMGAYAGLLYNGQDNELGSLAGAQTRSELGQEYMQRGAYEVFNGLSSVPYQLSRTGNYSASRLMAAGGVSIGLAGGAVVGSSMLMGMGGLGAAAAPVLGVGGLIAAGGLAAGVAGMEVYNNFFKPEGQQDITPSNFLQEIDKNRLRGQFREQFLGERYGVDYESRPAPLGGMTRDEWSKAALYDNSDPTNEYMVKHLTGEDQNKFVDEIEYNRAEKLNSRLNTIRATSFEDKASLQKAMQVMKRFMPKGTSEDEMADDLEKISDIAMQNGTNSDTALQEGASYASQMGHIRGTDDFTKEMWRYATTEDKVEQERMQYEGQRWAGLSSQFQSTMGPDRNLLGLGSTLSQRYRLDTQAEQSLAVSLSTGLQSGGLNLSAEGYERVAQYASRMNPVAGAAVSGAVGGLVSMGALTQQQGLSMADALSSAGMSALDGTLMGAMTGGDLGAYAYNAWHNGGSASDRFLDQSGRPIQQHDGWSAIQVYNKWAPFTGVGSAFTGTIQQQANQMMGGNASPEMISAFLDSGTFGLQRLANQKSYEASMAGAGIQLKGIELSENFYWGKNQGGTWDNPASHSAWGIEDRQIAMQRSSQQADFADQWTRMTFSNEMGIAREGNQQARMDLNRNYQSWQWSANYNQFQQQQTWARQDWVVQDEQMQLNFSWQMEDLDEAIRSSSGRQRRQLIRQRDRAATSENLQEEQVDTQRKRQEELWAAQDERYRKEREYTVENQKLDQQSFDLNKKQREETYKMDVSAYERRLKEYEEENKLQDELRELQRKFQYDQLQLQKESAGVQAGAAATQKQINDGLISIQENMEKTTGALQETFKYDKAVAITEGVRSMMLSINVTDEGKLQALRNLFLVLSGLDAGTLQRIMTNKLEDN